MVDQLVNFLNQPENVSKVQEQLVKIYEENPYTETIIAVLEKYLEEQISTQCQDLRANLHLLQLYKLFPQKRDLVYTKKVLIKSMMNMTHRQYLACSYMVAQDAREDKDISQVIEAANLLESAQFAEFWKLSLDFGKAIPGFEASIRSFVSISIAKSHDAIPLSALEKLLNINGKALEALIKEEKWTMEKSLVRIPANGDNVFRERKFKENIELNEILNVVNALAQ